ncbi:MAG: hypothetical protein WBP13_10610 [Methylophilaceae bacterium]
MNEFYFSQTSSTFSYVLLAAGLIANQHPTFTNRHEITYQKGLLQAPYSSNGNESTYNSMRGVISGSYDSNVKNYEQSVSVFYEKLLAHQESLGSDFEKILYENIWNLYES